MKTKSYSRYDNILFDIQKKCVSCISYVILIYCLKVLYRTLTVNHIKKKLLLKY